MHADLELSGGSILKDVELACGPKGNMVLFADASLRFETDLDQIRRGVFPSRLMSLRNVTSIEFSETTAAEEEAIEAFKGKRSDFYQRQWMKATISVASGPPVQNVYIYDGCTYRNGIETSKVDLVRPRRIVVKGEL